MTQLSEAIELFMSDKRRQNFSENTLSDYAVTFRKLISFLQDDPRYTNDPEFTEITPNVIRSFLDSLKGVSAKTVLNRYCALSSLWTWAVDEGDLCQVHIMRKVKPPRPDKRAIVPFTRAEVKQVLGVLTASKPFTKKDGEASQARELDALTAARNRAIIYFLLDTGVRASEICGIRVKHVRPGEQGGYLAEIPAEAAKMKRGRLVAISAITWRLVRAYLDARVATGPEDYLFTTNEGGQMKRDTIRQMMDHIKQRTGIREVNAHRFRHTFAITYLRNGGDTFSLQAMLGHTTLDMVKRYLAIATADIERVHLKASPVSNWELQND